MTDPGYNLVEIVDAVRRAGNPQKAALEALADADGLTDAVLLDALGVERWGDLPIVPYPDAPGKGKAPDTAPPLSGQTRQTSPAKSRGRSPAAGARRPLRPRRPRSLSRQQQAPPTLWPAGWRRSTTCEPRWAPLWTGWSATPTPGAVCLPTRACFALARSRRWPRWPRHPAPGWPAGTPCAGCWGRILDYIGVE